MSNIPDLESWQALLARARLSETRKWALLSLRQWATDPKNGVARSRHRDSHGKRNRRYRIGFHTAGATGPVGRQATAVHLPRAESHGIMPHVGVPSLWHPRIPVCSCHLQHPQAI